MIIVQMINNDNKNEYIEKYAAIQCNQNRLKSTYIDILINSKMNHT